MTTLYRFFDTAGQLLYVGISSRFAARFERHRETKAWWPEIARTDLQHFETRSEALAAELAAIRAEKPLYNVAGTLGRGQASQGTSSPPISSAEPPVGWWCHIATGETPWAAEGPPARWYADYENGGGEYSVRSVGFYQGRVKAVLAAKLMVQLFSFWDGEPTDIRAFDFDGVRFRFYETWEDWIDGSDRIVGAPEGFTRREMAVQGRRHREADLIVKARWPKGAL